jgi:hypothetical protein
MGVNGRKFKKFSRHQKAGRISQLEPATLGWSA